MLGIETSCDETAAAVVSGDGRVLGEALASSSALWEEWGGVVPSVARMAHEEAIEGVVGAALQRAGADPRDLSAVAVTRGPGLGLCLRVGVAHAMGLSHRAGVPLVPVHHMEAHALVARLPPPAAAAAPPRAPPVEFPFVALLVSGGHNVLVLVDGVGRYTELGATLDDAVGEAFDKAARVLGLDLSRGGGPALEALAREGDPTAVVFPRPLRHRANCDFSYAGLKTALRLAAEARGVGPPPAGAPAGVADALRGPRADLAASFQKAAVLHLAEKTRRAVGWAQEMRPGLRHFVVAGGVAANAEVRAAMEEVAAGAGLTLVCPPPRLCTDNGVMVAWAGVERLALGLGVEPPAEYAPGPEDMVELLPRWPLGARDARATSPKRAKSMKQKRMAPSLTEATLAAVAGNAPTLVGRRRQAAVLSAEPRPEASAA